MREGKTENKSQAPSYKQKLIHEDLIHTEQSISSPWKSVVQSVREGQKTKAERHHTDKTLFTRVFIHAELVI